MKNNILNFDKEVQVVGEYINYDFTDTNFLINIYDLYKGTNFIKKDRIEDDEFLEGFSSNKLENKDYWDIILFLNNMISPENLPKNNDIIFAKAEEEFSEKQNLLENIIDINLLTDYEKENHFNIILEKLSNENEKYRIISYINEAFLNDMLSEITNLKKISIDEDLIKFKSNESNESE